MTLALGDPMDAVRKIRKRAESKLFVGVRIVPWLWDLPPKRFGTGRPTPYLEDMLLDVQELVVIGGHVGFPWFDEVISLAHKSENSYVDTSANASMLSPKRRLVRRDDLGRDGLTKEKILGGKARRVFKL